MSLPSGWEVGPDGLPRPKRRKFDLADLAIDEVAFVKRGANQRAHIVLSKEDTVTPWMDKAPGFKTRLAQRGDLTMEHTISDEGFSVDPESTPLILDPPAGAVPELGSAKTVASYYEANPDEYDRQLGRRAAKGVAKDDQADPYGDASIRYDDAKELAEAYATDPLAYDRQYAPKVTREPSGMALVLRDIAKTNDPATIAAMLERDPGLYDALLGMEQ